MVEIWKDIEGYEGYYQISNLGRVKRLERKDKFGVITKEMIKKNVIDKSGYQRTDLKVNGNHKNVLVHRLVAQAFIPNPNNYPMVNHKDENKANPRVDNLEWCTNKYNSTYNDVHLRNCIKVYQYSLQGELVKEWKGASLAKEYGFSNSNIQICCSGRAKTHKGYVWSYKKLSKKEVLNIVNSKKVRKSESRFYQYDMNENLIKIWETVKDFEGSKFKSDGVYRCCKGQTKQYKGFIWKRGE